MNTNQRRNKLKDNLEPVKELGPNTNLMHIKDLYEWKKKAQNDGSGAVGIDGMTLDRIIDTAIRGCQARILVSECRLHLLESAVAYDKAAFQIHQFLEEEPFSLVPIVDGERDQLIPYDQFVKMCMENALIDYDGMGNWATETMKQAGNYVNTRWVYPSHVINGVQKPDWATHVLWHNR
jgi:hypothetical protein